MEHKADNQEGLLAVAAVSLLLVALAVMPFLPLNKWVKNNKEQVNWPSAYDRCMAEKQVEAAGGFLAPLLRDAAAWSQTPVEFAALNPTLCKE